MRGEISLSLHQESLSDWSEVRLASGERSLSCSLFRSVRPAVSVLKPYSAPTQEAPEGTGDEDSAALGKVLLVSPFPRLKCLLAAFHDGEHRVDDSGIVDTSRT